MKDILIEILSPNSLVIVESTVEPGFIEDEMVPIISKSGRLFVSSSFGILKSSIISNNYQRLSVNNCFT